MKVLLITEHWVHDDPAYGPTNNMHNLVGSLEATGLDVSYEHLFISPTEIWSTAQVDHELNTRQYDMAVVSVFHHLPSPGMLQHLGGKVVMLWWDSIVSMAGVQHYAQYTPQIVFDWGHGEELPNCYAMQVPQDTRIYNRDNSIPEDIDVSFAGAVDHIRPERGRMLDMLRSAGIGVYVAGGRGPGYSNLSVADYAHIFKRSKICLNFAQGHMRVQRKGRVFEIAACGKLMLSNNPEAMQGKDGPWFVETEDFAGFNENNIVQVVRSYLIDITERQRIADNMYRKYTELYAPVHFWKKLFNICKLNCASIF